MRPLHSWVLILVQDKPSQQAAFVLVPSCWEGTGEGVCLPRLQRMWCSFYALHLNSFLLVLSWDCYYLWGNLKVDCVWLFSACKTVWHQQHLPCRHICSCVVHPGFHYFSGEEKLFLCLSFPSEKSLCWLAGVFLRHYPRPQGNALAQPGFREGSDHRWCLGWKRLSGKERWSWGQWEGGNCLSAWAESQNIWISGNIKDESASETENCLLKWEELISHTVWLHHMVLRCPGWVKKIPWQYKL